MNPSWRVAALAVLLALGACGGGDGQITGTISGLTADGLQLSDGVDTVTLASGATSFTFPTLLTDGVTYNVHVTTQPTGLYCTVANGSGTVSSSTPSANITVTCSASFGVSGTVSGLSTSGLVINDGIEDFAVGVNAKTFAFPTLLADGTDYAITVKTQPTGQICTVANGSGTIDGAAATDSSITCK